MYCTLRKCYNDFEVLTSQKNPLFNFTQSSKHFKQYYNEEYSLGSV
jgi:hypothetical protein